MNIATSKKRILQFIEYKGITKQTFFEETGLKRGFLDSDKLNTSIPDIFLASIVAAYPEINPEWLLLGVGEMLRNAAMEATPVPSVPIANDALLLKMLDKKDAEITKLNRTIGQLQERVRSLEAAPSWGKSTSSARTKNAKEFARLPI